MMSYIFGGNTGLTAEEIAKRRAQAAAMAAQRAAPQNLGEGLASAGASIGAGMLRRQANMAEEANAAGRGMDAMSQPMGQTEDMQRQIARALMQKRQFGFGGGR